MRTSWFARHVYLRPVLSLATGLRRSESLNGSRERTLIAFTTCLTSFGRGLRRTARSGQ